MLSEHTSIEQTLHYIYQTKRQVPKKEIEFLLTQKNEVIPFLIKELDKVIASPESADELDIRPIFSIFFLAHCRHQEAFSRILELLILPNDVAIHVFGHEIILNYAIENIIASTFDGDFLKISTLIDNQSIDEDMRSILLDSLIPLVSLEKIDKKIVTHYLLTLIKTIQETHQLLLWESLIEVVLALSLNELAPIIIQIAESNESKGKLDFIDLQKFKTWFNASHIHDNECVAPYHLINIFEDMDEYDCFNATERRKQLEIDLHKFLTLDSWRDYPDDFESDLFEPHTMPIHREHPKCGRNDPCYCGSGKKFKKCCLH